MLKCAWEAIDFIENVPCLITKYVTKDQWARYKFSNYLIDPNKFRFRTGLRILTLVFVFLQKVNRKCNKSFDFLTNMILVKIQVKRGHALYHR